MSNGFPKEVDGENRPFRDSILNGLVGKWKVTGKIVGKRIEQFCEAHWVLNHQFLRVHFIDAASKARRDRRGATNLRAEYEAMVFVGYDNMSERYVVHWLDVFGGRFSETLGFGTRTKRNSIRFVFESPSGPLHNTFTWNPRSRIWSILIKQKDENGRWTVFAEETLQRAL